MSEQKPIKRYCISRPPSRALCIVEAEDEQAALSRAQLIADETRSLHFLASLDKMTAQEMHEKQPNVLPYYKEGYFQLIELRDSISH